MSFTSGVPIHHSPTSLPPPVQSRRRSTTLSPSNLPAPGYTPRPAPRPPVQGSRSDWRSKLRRPHPFTENSPGSFSSSISNGRIVHTERNRDTGSVFGSGLGWRNVFGVKGFLLMITLVLSFIILILGLVYAGRTMSRIEDGLRQVVIPSSTKGGVAQIYTINEIVVRDILFELDTRDESLTHKLVVRDISQGIQPRHDHDDDNDDDDDDKEDDSDTVVSRTASKSSASASLYLYVATVPFLSMTHASILLLMLYLLSASARKTRELSEKMNNSSDSDSDNLESNAPQEPRIESLRPYVPLVSVATTAVIATAWVTINAIQTQCELTNTTSDICPILVPWSKTAGVHAMSTARISLSWITVILYLIFMLAVVKDSRLLTRPKSPTIIQISRPQILSDPTDNIDPPPRPRRSSMKSRSPSRDPSRTPKTVRFSLDNDDDEKLRAERESIIPPVPVIPQQAMRRSMDVNRQSVTPMEPPPEYTPSDSSTSSSSSTTTTTSDLPVTTLPTSSPTTEQEADPEAYDSGSEYSSTTDSPCFGENRKRLTINSASLKSSIIPEIVSPTPSIINSYGLGFDTVAAAGVSNEKERKGVRTSIGTMSIKDKRRSSSL